MPKFEYKVDIRTPTVPKDDADILNKYGERGWELVAILKLAYGDNKWIFKREIQE